MAKATGTIRRKLAKGKAWYKIHAPKVFNETLIGEAIASNPESLKGRIIETQYNKLSGELTKHHLKSKVKITKIEGDNAYTELISYEISRPFLQRLIRRRMTKIDDVIDMKLKDKDVRIKYLALTVYKANSSQAISLRHALKEELRKTFKGMDMDTLIINLALNKLQRQVSNKIKKIFPMRFLDIRKVELLKPKKASKIKIKEKKSKETKKEGEGTMKEEPKKETKAKEKTEETPKEEPITEEEITITPAA